MSNILGKIFPTDFLKYRCYVGRLISLFSLLIYKVLLKKKQNKNKTRKSNDLQVVNFFQLRIQKVLCEHLFLLLTAGMHSVLRKSEQVIVTCWGNRGVLQYNQLPLLILHFVHTLYV